MVVSGGENHNLSTLAMVFILVGVVKCVFICFALMALCYRYSSKYCNVASSSSNFFPKLMYRRHSTRPSLIILYIVIQCSMYVLWCILTYVKCANVLYIYSFMTPRKVGLLRNILPSYWEFRSLGVIWYVSQNTGKIIRSMLCRRRHTVWPFEKKTAKTLATTRISIEKNRARAENFPSSPYFQEPFPW